VKQIAIARQCAYTIGILDCYLPKTNHSKSRCSDDSRPSGSHQKPTTNYAVNSKSTELRAVATQQRKFVHHKRRPDRQMISAMLQSTMPTREMSELLLAFEKSGPKVELVPLSGCDFLRYRNATHNLEDPAILVSRKCLDSFPGIQAKHVLSEASGHESDESYDGSLHHIPVSRWTDLVAASKDEFASRLIYLFLKCLNPYWRLVEEDLFLQASRMPGKSLYCSSFLVNAILACASVCSISRMAPESWLIWVNSFILTSTSLSRRLGIISHVGVIITMRQHDFGSSRRSALHSATCKHWLCYHYRRPILCYWCSIC
jgi:hypothetical protein